MCIVWPAILPGFLRKQAQYRRLVAAALLIYLATPLVLFGGLLKASDEAEPNPPKLLLTAKLTKRLKRDRERQTPRWINFENRVKSVTDSPERGFELALYYVVTRDAGRAHEAIAWVTAHPQDVRQRALVLDWCGEAASEQERAALRAGLASKGKPKDFQERRNCQFAQLASGQDAAGCAGTGLKLDGLLKDALEMEAACEYFITARINGAEDERGEHAEFFQHLPVEFLLAQRPEEVERPDWKTHVAALALVTLDPNLEASQFLQGWAVEDRQTLHEGPGVAYEFLWADPYLPGIAYQNLDPWLYEATGARLFARSDWTTSSCWIGISPEGTAQQNCPDGWQQQTARFGSLKLIPAAAKCMEIARQEVKESVIIWKLKRGERITYHDRKEIGAQADEAGMWHPGTNVEGKVCQGR